MSHNSSDREWLRGHTMMAGARVGRHLIKCSEAGCGKEHEIIDRGYKQLPFNEVTRRFTRDKWFVGKNERHDICPKCQKNKQQIRRSKRRASNAEVAKLFPPPRLVSTSAPMEPPVTTTMPDRPINRDDKRLINLKLHEVYIGEKEGYFSPHTDQSVAKDLGVPVKWVTDIREDLFGPAHSNSDIDDQLAKIEANKAVVINLGEQVTIALNEIKAIVVRMPALSDRLNEVMRATESLDRKAEIIRKAVS